MDRPLPPPRGHERGDRERVLTRQLRTEAALSCEANDPAEQGGRERRQGSHWQHDQAILAVRYLARARRSDPLTATAKDLCRREVRLGERVERVGVFARQIGAACERGPETVAEFAFEQGQRSGCLLYTSRCV